MTDERFPPEFEQRRKCEGCNVQGFDVQHRLNLSDQPLLCDECHHDPSQTAMYGSVIS